MIETKERQSSIVNALGLLLLALALLLSIPGIHAARADEPDMTPVGPADYAGLLPDTAEAPAAPEANDPEACGDPEQKARGDRARQQLLAGIPQPRPGESGVDAGNGVVFLNNRGYNYGSNAGPSDAQFLRLEREMMGESAPTE